MTDRPAIIVLTPLKNDAWILRRFLEVCRQFADRVIIADQGSTDGGLEICREFDNVTVLDNSASGYDEAARQIMLIAAARAMLPLPRILIALDADEVLAADAMSSADWQRMLAAPPGTGFIFEKPNLFLTPAMVERRAIEFPGAFADDGTTAHQAHRIHSPRLPPGRQSIALDGVKFLHYALTRPQAQLAKMRMYAALENVMQTKSLYWRRRYYWSKKVLRPVGPVEPTPRQWFAAWEGRGIDMTHIEDVQPYWQDLATLDLLLRHGARRFWYDDIWEMEWERLRAEQGLPGRVDPPPAILRAAIDGAQQVLEFGVRLRARLRRKREPA
jgi:glycosyltransferase involved in cell wall biosynthesis